MPRQPLKKPLLSFGAKKSIGDQITFGSWGGIQYSQNKRDPKQPMTEAQVAQQRRIADAQYMLHKLKPQDRWSWYRSAWRKRSGLCGSLHFVKNTASKEFFMDRPLAGYDVKDESWQDTFNVYLKVHDVEKHQDLEDLKGFEIHTFDRNQHVSSKTPMEMDGDTLRGRANHEARGKTEYRVYDTMSKRYITGNYIVKRSQM